MAEFLVECMLADALLLDQCEAQHLLPVEQDDQDQDVPLETPSASLSQIEIRRKRNREWMQRSRRTQQEDIERMRVTEEALEQYLGMALETRRFCLEAERWQLEQSLVQHSNAHRSLKEILVKDQQVSQVKPQYAASTAQDIESAFPEYKPVTLAQAQEAIDACYRGINQYGQRAKPLSHWIADASTPTRTFGWTVACDLRSGSYIYLSLTKQLNDVRAQQAMQQSWAAVSRPYVADKSPSQRLVRSMLLQELDENMSVIGSDWQHPLKPGICMRSIKVRNCGATANGFYVSRSTLNPQDPELRRNAPHGVEYMDAFTWHDFKDEAEGCLVTLKTLWHYDTHENLHMRFVNALSSAWRWESEVMHQPTELLKV